MSYHYSLALVEAFWVQGFLDSDQCAELKSTRTAERSSFDDKKKGSSRRSPSGTTSEPSTASLGVARWMSSLAAFPASPSQSPAGNGGSQTSGTSGLIPFALLEKSDQDTASWKTCQVSLLTNTLALYSVTFPRAGILHDGKLYRLPNLELRISEIGSGLWPTVTQDSATDRSNRYAQGGTPLTVAVKRWPTPTESFAARGGIIQPESNHDTEKGFREKDPSMTGGQLNPTWVEWLMGWPLNWTSLEVLSKENIDEWHDKTLRAVWWTNDPSEVAERQAGCNMEESEVLQSQVLREGKRDSEPQQGYITEKGSATGQSREMRDMWPTPRANKIGGYSSPRFRPTLEQTVIAKASQQGQSDDSMSAMPHERTHEGWHMGTVPRVSQGIKHRVDRLKALGNGQIPSVVRAAWELLNARSNTG